MAFIVEVPRKSGNKYKVVWYENGKQVSKIIDNKREANAFRKQKEAEVILGLSKKPSDITFGEYAKEFMEIHSLSLKTTTKINYDRYLKLLNEKFENMRLVDIKPITLDNYFKYLKTDRNLKMNTIKKYRDVLKLILKSATTKDIIISNPIDKIDFKFIEVNNEVVNNFKDRREINLTEMLNDLKTLLDSFDMPYYKHFILLGYMTGMRKGEILALMWDCIDFDKKLIYVNRNLNAIGEVTTPKTINSIRTISIHDNLYYLLHEIRYYQEEMKKFYGKEYLQNNLVICKANGEFLNTMTVSKTFYEKNKIYDTKITPHKLRHLFASKMSAVNKKIVRDLLGHATFEMTEHYQDYEDKNNDETIEIMNDIFKPL